MPFNPPPRTTADLMILATQLVLAHVLDQVGKDDAALRDSIARGFDNAANDAERMALKGADEPNSEDAASLLQMIEGLRSLTFPKKEQPRHGV